MSEEHARQFIAAVEQDSVLQQKIQSFEPATATADIVKLGAEHSLHFSVAEFSETLNSVLNARTGEITDEALESVSGGVSGTFAVEKNPNVHVPTGTPHPVYWVKTGAYHPKGLLSFSNSNSLDQ